MDTMDGLQDGRIVTGKEDVFVKGGGRNGRDGKIQEKV